MVNVTSMNKAVARLLPFPSFCAERLRLLQNLLHLKENYKNRENMKPTLPLLFALCCFHWLLAQKPYFQQEVNYKINVTLNDRQHTLRGDIEIEYINNSSDALEVVYLHLWANAFQSRNTAFARQQLRSGKTEFYFAKKEDLGGYSDLQFTVDGQPSALELQKDNPDIGLLRLPKPLPSGGRIKIATPFTLKIPASFSRLGHVGESYQMTQWYPKPAVYDRQGWHPMPYLDQGEFYSEFGNFDVTITLPENYVVGATGVLQTESERAFLEQKVAASSTLLASLSAPANVKSDTAHEEFPRSSSTLKTIRYTAENVHDFAWFADKRFYVQKGAVTLPSGRMVDTWAMFTDFERQLWKEAINYINRAMTFYSNAVGEYPYPHATAVQSALSAGGGMEYPMITVIGSAGTPKELDIVITHEVGHNWFYGILASNERDHAWMDEGLNSYYEKRYSQQYYPSDLRDDLLPNIIRGGSQMSLTEVAYLWQARRHLDQAPATTSDDFTSLNYLLGAYEKPAVALAYLEKYAGQLSLDAAMQAYYEQWKFKHPQPTDLRAVLEEETGMNLNWLFDGFIASNARLDYAIKGLRKADNGYRVLVRNKSEIPAPFTLDAITQGIVQHSKWYEGFTGERVLEFPFASFDHITLDAARTTLDINRKNNHISAGGSKIEPFQLRILPGLENDRRTELFLTPVLGWNNYNKLMLGALLYNSTIPYKNFDFAIAPLFSLGSKDLVGVGEVGYTFYPSVRGIHSVRLGASGRTFHYNRQFALDYDLKYARLVPAVQVELGKKPAADYQQSVQWRTIWLNEELARFSPVFGNYQGNAWSDTYIHEFSYLGESRRALNPYSVFLALEQQSYEDGFSRNQQYLKASLEVKHTFHYAPQKGWDVRIFAGGFLTNSRRNAGAIFPGAFNLISQGYNDYRYDDLYFGRRDDKGIWSQQISLRDGSFKTPIGTGFNLGRSNNFIAALNLKVDLPVGLPFNLPLKPYFDIGYFDNAMPTGASDNFQDQLLWSGGVMLELVKDVVEIYFPLLNSANLGDRLAERGSYWNRIAFLLDVRRLNPKALLQRINIGG